MWGFVVNQGSVCQGSFHSSSGHNARHLSVMNWACDFGGHVCGPALRSVNGAIATVPRTSSYNIIRCVEGTLIRKVSRGCRDLLMLVQTACRGKSPMTQTAPSFNM